MYPRMKELREKAGLSQESLTSYLRINLRKYKKYESGKKQPPSQILLQLSLFYDVSIPYICGNTDNPERRY
ncbi:MAG TPA: helix-turn-helix transcriptional regulator [Candidatus Scatavimonas merdigallinarum]|uniref:Helix-turn-helix transcriptional regulator n=1 Tax=Candidatus Scatavimonas merdigallinarum TaxID=2840914 RepID=A0A9D1CUE1_9FIRM|nr:helix-turn-helix transcriptional regulator [Candidatus Scatavimonas merdigallinarum]